jgi:SAM-dependent methyltransferase
VPRHSAAGSVTPVDDSASFRGPADNYDRHVGRYSRQLARALIGQAGVHPGQRALDVGCGPGALAAELAALLGSASVAAVDPSAEYLDACRARLPGVEAHIASGETLPFGDDSFDVALSQLVLNFLTDAPASVREMRRVTRPGGVVAAAVWDYAGEMRLLRTYWDAAISVDDAARELDEGVRMSYCTPAELEQLFAENGLGDVTTAPLVVSAHYTDFDDLWAPLAAGGGPAGAHARSLSPGEQTTVSERMFELLGSPHGAFDLTARAWSVTGHA